MQELMKELDSVEYGDTGVKQLHFKIKTDQRCIRLHWHERMEVIKVNSGSMEIDVSEQKMVIYPNELYIIPPKMPHSAVAKSDVDYDVIMFDVRLFYNKTGIASKFLEPVYNGCAKFDSKTGNEKMLHCYQEILRANSENRFYVVSLIYQFISLLYETCLQGFAEGRKDGSIVTEAIQYIEENYAQDISTKTIAEKLGYSPEHFCRKFKEETRLTPMKYLKIYRLEAALKLLKEKEYSVNEVALLCGFDDANYFTRCFKAHFDAAPTKYMRRSANGQ